jgi:hypothetical protein
LPFQLNHVEAYEKSGKSKKDFDTFKRTSKESETSFFCADSKSKIEHCACASKDKIIRIWPKCKKILFYFSPKVHSERDFMMEKSQESKRSKISHLGNFNSPSAILCQIFHLVPSTFLSLSISLLWSFVHRYTRMWEVEAYFKETE